MTPSHQDAWNYSEQNSWLREKQIVVGMTQHPPVNGIWQVWVSFYRLAAFDAATDFCLVIKS